MKITMTVLHLSVKSLHAPFRQVSIRSTQHVLVANKKRQVHWCKNALAHSRFANKNVECANVFFTFNISCM